MTYPENPILVLVDLVLEFVERHDWHRRQHR